MSDRGEKYDTPYGQQSSQNYRRNNASQKFVSQKTGAYRTPVPLSSKMNSMSLTPQDSQFRRFAEVTKRSYLADEFVIRNPTNNMSCFLNVALQALWVFPAVRMNIITFCELRSGGPP